MRWFRRNRGPDRAAPRTAGAAVRRALLAVLDRDLARAEALLSRAVRLDSGDLDAYFALARVYRQRGELGRAIHVHQNLLLREGVDPARRRQALAELAGDFRQGGFLRRAIASYEEVLAGDRRDRAALSALARLYRDAREYEKALDVERRLARIDGRDADPLEAELWTDLAGVARGEGRTSDARRALKRALRRNDRCVRAWVALGDLEVERGRPKAALAAWKRVPALDRRQAAEVYPRLAAGYAAAGRTGEFEAWLRQLVEAEPDDPGARLALARSLAGRGASDEAVAAVRELLDRMPDNLEAHAARARILLAEHRDPDAVKALAELLEVLERSSLLRSRESSR